MVDVPAAEFEAMVADAFDQLPPELAAALDNVGVVVRDGTSRGSLFGLYEGRPLTDREAYGAGELVMPDRVTLFRRTICAACSSVDQVREQVRITLIHELAHHFGIDDDRLHELGWA